MQTDKPIAEPTVDALLAENRRRTQALEAPFDPETGQGAPGERVETDLDLGDGKRHWWLPRGMMPQAQALIADGAVPPERREEFERLRIRHDFAYWAGRYVRVKPKGGGDDVLLRLTYPQRKFVDVLEQQRLGGKPIRIVLLKARQWGGSTVAQMYMAWMQLTHSQGLNSLIIAHQGTCTDEIKDMYDRMIRAYPASLLHPVGEPCDPREAKLVNVGRSRAIWCVPQRNCKIKIGTAERPDSCRGGDYNLVHLSEVGLWKTTLGKKPEDIIRAACGGVLYRPNTMIVYESTANGIGNFFHHEYIDARDNPRAQFRALFVSWHEIEQNRLPLGTEAEARALAQWLIDHRMAEDAPTKREEPGRYLWWLWQRGATLEGIKWYMTERAKHSEHGSMAAECPTDDVEAFVNSGASVFDKYRVENLRPGCRPPSAVGEIEGAAPAAKPCPQLLDDLKFVADSQGRLWVWEMPEPGVADRYLAVVDIGGRSSRSDWSVVVVIDRIMMPMGGKPRVVAQWYGHADMDILAWKSAQIAAYYDDALLVIESNTLETHDAERQVDGDQSQYILNQIKTVYPNLYARRQSEDDIRMRRPRKYGFHTNVVTKPMVISTLVRAVREGLYEERDERCVDEYLVYERKPNGAYGAIPGAHDDLLMTRAIGLHICFYEMRMPQRIAAPPEEPTSPPERLF